MSVTRPVIRILFAWVLMNQGGVPVPVIPSLLAAGALAGRGRTSLILTVAVVVGAALCGDLMWYSLGRWRGRRAMGILCRLSPGSARCIQHAESLFLAHRTGFLLSARFLPELNAVAAGLAGAARMNVSRYILAATGSAVVWAGTWTGLGYLLSDAISAVATRLGGPLLMLIERALGWVSRI